MFKNCKTKDEVKKLFRRLAKYLHPDHGGEPDLMSLLSESCKEAIESFPEKVEEKKEEPLSFNGKYEYEYEDEIIDEEKLFILEDLLDYSEINKNFNPKFTLSMKEHLESFGFLTSNQYNALVRVYYSFRVEEKLKDFHKNEEKI